MSFLLAGITVMIAVLASVLAAPSTQSELHKEARNLTYKRSGCGRQDLCLHRRPDNDGLKAPGNLTLDRFTKWPCYCDVPTCRHFGDCCVDLVSETWQQPRPDTIQDLPVSAWQCHRFTDIRLTTSMGEDTLDTIRQFAWMVSKCPDDASPSVKRQCSGQVDELEEEYSYVHDVPVLARGALFRNVFCAACYGHAPTDLMPLSLELHCKDNTTENHQISNASYIAGEARWELPEENVNCSLEVQEYSNLVKLNAYLDQQGIPIVRQCRPLIDFCPKSWKDKDVASKCAAYSLVVIESDENGNLISPKNPIRYKNPHCALCHGVKMVKCIVDTGQRTSGYPGSMSLIFHFGLGGEVVGQRGCSAGFVWDALYRQCRPVFSCKGRHVASYCPRLNSLNSSSSQQHDNMTLCDRVALENHEYHVLENGSLVINETLQVVDKYQIVGDKAEICDDEIDIVEKVVNEFPELQGLLTLIFTCFSLIGLALHILVLLSLPRLRNLPGLISLATSMSFFTAQALFLWATSAVRPGDYTACVLVAVLLHFCYLKVFFWTSIMSYDIWRTFSHPTGHMRGRHSTSQRSQFVKYVIFASVVPACIVLCSLTLDLVDGTLTISPQYALASICWFGSRAGLTVFFVLPVATILLSNLAMYIIVVSHIREQRRAARFLVELSKRGEDTGHDQKYTENDCKLHFSIFNVMGGTWILGLLAGLVDHPVLWYIFIIIQGSQGVIIFILQILKPRVWDMIRNKIAGRDELSSRTSSTLATSSLNKNTSLIKHVPS